MRTAVKVINLLTFFSLLLTCSCRAESSSADSSVFLNGTEKRLPQKLREPVRDFFLNLKTSDLERVYSFAAPDYSNTVSFEVFERFFEEKWKLEEIELLSSSIFGRSFYILIRSVSKNGNETTLSYDAMFWRINGSKVEFINFPFSSSGAPVYGEIPTLFQ